MARKNNRQEAVKMMAEIDWEAVENNFNMLTDETLERFLAKIIKIRMDRSVTVAVHEEAFE